MFNPNRVALALVGPLLQVGWVSGGTAARAQGVPRPAIRPTTSTEVTSQFIMSTQATERLRMTSRRPLRQVFNQRAGIVTVKATRNDPTTVLVCSDTTAGNSLLTLVDVDGNREEYIVIVQPRPAQVFDVGMMQRQIQQAVPTANVRPILGGGNSVILTGTVARAEDIAVITAIAANIVRAGLPDPIVRAALQGGSGGWPPR